MAEPTKTAQRKSRIQNACDMCRRRKVRCDSATMPGNVCSECLKWNAECTHNLMKRKRGPKTGSFKKPSITRAKLKDVVNSIVDSADSYILPPNLELVRTLVIDLALHIRVLETELKDSSQAPSSSVSSTPSLPENEATESDSESVINELSEHFDILAVDHKQRHHGSSSTFQLVQSALDIKGELVGKQLTLTINTLKRPEFWSEPKWQTFRETPYPPFVFPEDELIHHLVDIYFAKINPYFPILHRPSLENSLSKGLHFADRGVGAITLMVCTLGSQHSDDPRTLLEGSDSEHSRGWAYFRQIQLVHTLVQPKCDVPLSIYELQLYTLAALYLHTSNIANAAFFLVGLGIRSAQQKGVHKPDFTIPNEPIETELWKRAFWGLMVFDVYGSATLGIPRATAIEDFDVDMPQEFDGEWDILPESTGMKKNADLKLSKLSFWRHYLKLSEVIGLSLRTLYSVRTSELLNGMDVSPFDWNRRAVLELDLALNEWVNSIPEHLKWHPEMQHEVFFHQSVMLYVTYYWAQIQVHKLFIYRSSQSHSGYRDGDDEMSNLASTTFSSLAICASAARSCIGLVEVQHRRRPFVPLPLLLGPLFDSGIVSLMSLWRSLRSMGSAGRGANIDLAQLAHESDKEMKIARRSIDFLGMYERRFHCAGRLCDLLNSMISVGQLPPLSASTSFFMRGEPDLRQGVAEEKQQHGRLRQQQSPHVSKQTRESADLASSRPEHAHPHPHTQEGPRYRLDGGGSQAQPQLITVHDDLTAALDANHTSTLSSNSSFPSSTWTHLGDGRSQEYASGPNVQVHSFQTRSFHSDLVSGSGMGSMGSPGPELSATGMDMGLLAGTDLDLNLDLPSGGSAVDLDGGGGGRDPRTFRAVADVGSGPDPGPSSFPRVGSGFGIPGFGFESRAYVTEFGNRSEGGMGTEAHNTNIQLDTSNNNWEWEWDSFMAGVDSFLQSVQTQTQTQM